MPLTTGHIEPFGSNIVATGSEKFNPRESNLFLVIKNSDMSLLLILFLTTFSFYRDVRHSKCSTGSLDRFPQRRHHNGPILSRRTGLHRKQIPPLTVSLCRSHFDALLSPVRKFLQSVIQTGCPIDSFSFVPCSLVKDLTQ